MARIGLPAMILHELTEIRDAERDGDFSQPMGEYDRVGREAWRKREKELVAAFKRKVFAASDVGLPSGLPEIKAEHLWDVAWEEGHSNGLHSVLDYWEELLPLALPLAGEGQ